MPGTAGLPYPSSRARNRCLASAVNQGWKQTFDDPIPLPSGRKLVTLLDVHLRDQTSKERSRHVPITQDGKVVDSYGYSFDLEDVRSRLGNRFAQTRAVSAHTPRPGSP